MKKFLLLLVLVGGSVYAYFWYIRGINLLQLEDANPLPNYGVAVRLPNKSSDIAGYSWYAASGMPTPRTGMAVAATGTKTYVAGGTDAFGRTSDVLEMYDARNDSWTRFSPMPHAAYLAAAGIVGDRLYVVGGYEGLGDDALSHVQAYDFGTNSWTVLAPMPRPVGGAAYAVADGRLHLIGGEADGSVLTDHLVFDPAAGKWTSAEGLVAGRDRAAAAVVGTKLVLVGGRKGSLIYNVSQSDVFDLRNGTWAAAKPMPRPRSDLALLPFGGRLYAFGGEAPTVTFSEIDVYDPVADAWATLPQKLPNPRHGMAAAQVEGSFFLIGGGRRPGGFSVSDLNEVFQATAKAAPAKP